MATETTDIASIVRYLSASTAQTLAEFLSPLGLTPQSTQYRMFVSGWLETEGILLLASETQFDADLRVFLAADNERALRDLLLAVPPRRLGLCFLTAAWMLPTVSEILDGQFLSLPEEHSAAAAFLGLKRGSGDFTPIPPEVFWSGARRRHAEWQNPPEEDGVIAKSKAPILARYRDLAHGAGRREHSQFLAEGPTILQRALRDGLPIESLLYTPELLKTDEGKAILEDARAAGVKRYRITDGLMGTLTTTRPLPTLLGALPIRFREAEELHTSEKTCLLLIEDVQNPDNLGMTLRTADAAGVEAIVLVGEKTDPFHKNCVRAARGAVGRVPLLFCAEPHDYLRSLRERGFRIAGGTARGDADLYQCNMEPPIVVVVGNEQTGISPALRELCTVLARIPMAPGQDSLNVGVASGLLLYEVTRRRLEAQRES